MSHVIRARPTSVGCVTSMRKPALSSHSIVGNDSSPRVVFQNVQVAYFTRALQASGYTPLNEEWWKYPRRLVECV